MQSRGKFNFERVQDADVNWVLLPCMCGHGKDAHGEPPDSFCNRIKECGCRQYRPKRSVNREPLPAGVRKILEALLSQTIAHCLRRGIRLENFYQALIAEQERSPDITVVDLLARTLKQLAP